MKIKDIVNAGFNMVGITRNKEPESTILDFRIIKNDTHKSNYNDINYCATFYDLTDGVFYFKYYSAANFNIAMKKFLSFETTKSKLCYVSELDRDYHVVTRCWTSPSFQSYINNSFNF